MRIWIDTEFNEFQGELISLALVAENGLEWYEALPCLSPKPWAAHNVMPVIGKAPISDPALFSALLAVFLLKFPEVHIIADWPEDISLFCRAMIVGPGARMPSPKLTFELKTDLAGTAGTSAIPHNALEDARALMRSHLAQEAAMRGE